MKDNKIIKIIISVLILLGMFFLTWKIIQLDNQEEIKFIKSEWVG